MKVLVTGGAGYIGSHACKALASAGHVPVVFDNLRTGHRWAVQWGPMVHGDICDTNAVRKAIKEHDIDAVMHFAALAYVGESVRQPGLYYAANVGGLVSVLDAMVSCDVDRIIFSSTCATYGIPESLPITEDSERAPINPYGHSKLMCEQVLIDHATAHGIGSIALRYFNAAGADAAGDIGEFHDPETHLIPLVLEAAADGDKTITVLGDDYDTPDGTCVRDYIHVTDLADAHVSALERCAPGQAEHFNLGTGTGASVREIINAAEEVTGRKIAVEVGERRPGDPPILVANAARAREALGFAPRHSEIRNVIETAWQWMEKMPAGNQPRMR
ncbi:UDP-glucose 4-epimerase GalE [Erythrobacter sp. MTPC3]|uniref:UDP-glucose 4-epimerase GalE n=1 Tax=Erythrobacter sp. MTPC3 TaxID=3056564 RepID=UPI0036F3119B